MLYVSTRSCEASIRNYNLAFVVGSKNVQASSYKDHAATNIHKRALLLLKKQSSSGVTEYVPMPNALHNLEGEVKV